MSLTRHEFLRFAGATIVLSALPGVAAAIEYPQRPVRWIVPAAPGSTPDIIARLLGQWLTERLGQPFIIENRPAAGGNLATEAAAHAPADGYTILSIVASTLISPSLYEKLNFDFVRDIAPVASVGRFPHAISVHPTVPVNTIPELIAYARANPGKLNEGSLTGASVHMAAELFKIAAGVDIVHVPYRGGAATITEVLSGNVQVSFDLAGLVAEHIKAGRLRGLAITTAERWEGLPSLPTVAETVPGFEVSSAGGVGAPKNTPVEIIERLNSEINAGLADEKIKARLTDLGATSLVGSPSDFGRFISAEIERWGKAVRAANIKVQ
jgi:tripartite-type tricarboxylate transporter receptor subunit TctC